MIERDLIAGAWDVYLPSNPTKPGCVYQLDSGGTWQMIMRPMARWRIGAAVNALTSVMGGTWELERGGGGKDVVVLVDEADRTTAVEKYGIKKMGPAGKVLYSAVKKGTAAEDVVYRHEVLSSTADSITFSDGFRWVRRQPR